MLLPPCPVHPSALRVFEAHHAHANSHGILMGGKGFRAQRERPNSRFHVMLARIVAVRMQSKGQYPLLSPDGHP
jgi:hypothetical protein